MPCYVQLSRNVPKTEKLAKFLIQSRSGVGRDVIPRLHIQQPNVMHVVFQAASSTGMERNYLTFQRASSTGVKIISCRIWH